MKRKYPFKLFLMMVLLNFTIRHFYFFLPGLVLSIIGIWNQTCLALGLALLLVDLIVSVVEQLQIRKTALEKSENEEFNELMDAAFASDDPDAFRRIIEEKLPPVSAEEAQEQSQRQQMLQKLVVYRTLNGAIHQGMTLAEMVEAFREMCEISVGDPDDLLFETGTYDFTGEKLFYFSLVRQFQFLSDEEYVQLRLDVTYLPCPKTRFLLGRKWSSRINGDFFHMVTDSRAYRVAQVLPIHNVIVRIEET